MIASGTSLRYLVRRSLLPDTQLLTLAPEADEIALEMRDNKGDPTLQTHGYILDFEWNGASFARMRNALRLLPNPASMDTYLFRSFLGQMDMAVPPSTQLPIPGVLSCPDLPELNSSQEDAVRHVLQNPLTLIQGPPGTGKTVTSATIVYHFL